MMRQDTLPHWGAALLCCAALSVNAADTAQAPAPAGGPDSAQASTDAAVPAPVPAFESVLESFRPFRADEPMRDWREVNDEVGGLGGHVGHLRPAATEEGKR